MKCYCKLKNIVVCTFDFNLISNSNMEEIHSLKKFSKYQVLLVVILAMTQFSVVLDFMVMSPLGDLLIKDLKINPAQFGLIVSSYALSAGISGFLTASFADKFDRKKLLLFFYAGFIIGTVVGRSSNCDRYFRRGNFIDFNGNCSGYF